MTMAIFNILIATSFFIVIVIDIVIAIDIENSIFVIQ